MAHALHTDFFWPDLELHWVMLIPGNQVSDFIIQGCTEQGGLTIFGTVVENMTYGVDKTHVSHAICLINNDGFHIFHIHDAAFHQVD